MWLLLGKLATGDAVVRSDNSFRELRVLQGPEAKETLLQKLVVCAVDIVLTITDCYQIWVLDVDINTRYHTAFGFRALEGEEVRH